MGALEPVCGYEGVSGSIGGVTFWSILTSKLGCEGGLGEGTSG